MNKKQVASWDQLLTKGMSERTNHGVDSATLRRNFLRSAASIAGLGLSSGLCLPRLAQAAPDDEDGGKGKSVLPNPIPGGVSPLGIFIHHFPVSPTGTPLQNLTEPSQITDFKGFVELNRIRGAGIGKVFPALALTADLSVMTFHYTGHDGEQH